MKFLGAEPDQSFGTNSFIDNVKEDGIEDISKEIDDTFKQATDNLDLSSNVQFLSPNIFQKQEKAITRARSATIPIKGSLQDFEESQHLIGNFWFSVMNFSLHKSIISFLFFLTND